MIPPVSDRCQYWFAVGERQDVFMERESESKHDTSMSVSDALFVFRRSFSSMNQEG
jgi:hypothetical protein